MGKMNNIKISSSSIRIEQLKLIKNASITDLVSGENIIWLMKNIIIEQEERIARLEFKVSQLYGEVEED